MAACYDTTVSDSMDCYILIPCDGILILDSGLSELGGDDSSRGRGLDHEAMDLATNPVSDMK